MSNQEGLSFSPQEPEEIVTGVPELTEDEDRLFEMGQANPTQARLRFSGNVEPQTQASIEQNVTQSGSTPKRSYREISGGQTAAIPRWKRGTGGALQSSPHRNFTRERLAREQAEQTD